MNHPSQHDVDKPRITGAIIRTAEKLFVERHTAGDLVVTTYRFPCFLELALIMSTPAKGGALTIRYCVGDDDRTTPEGAAEMLNALDGAARLFFGKQRKVAL